MYVYTHILHYRDENYALCSTKEEENKQEKFISTLKQITIYNWSVSLSFIPHTPEPKRAVSLGRLPNWCVKHLVTTTTIVIMGKTTMTTTMMMWKWFKSEQKNKKDSLSINTKYTHTRTHPNTCGFEASTAHGNHIDGKYTRNPPFWLYITDIHECQQLEIRSGRLNLHYLNLLMPIKVIRIRPKLCSTKFRHSFYALSFRVNVILVWSLDFFTLFTSILLFHLVVFHFYMMLDTIYRNECCAELCLTKLIKWCQTNSLFC